MPTVFVSYRREETAGEARALYNELSTKLGKDSVFMDVDNIALGRDFRQILQEHLASCDLLLVMVGRGWLDIKNAAGKIRLEEPSDFVRLEIESALKRNIPVTPVLVQGAQMPTVDQLPGDIKDFAYRNGFELSHSRWASDVAEMCKRLGLVKEQAAGTNRKVNTSGGENPTDSRMTQVKVARTEAPAAQQRNRNSWLATVVATVMAIAAAGGGFLYYRTIVEDEAKIEQARVETANAKAEAENRIAALKAEAEKARMDAEAKALADAKAAKAAADVKAANDAAAAARAENDRAKAAAVRAEKERAAAAVAQAEKEQAERARVAAQAAEAEKKRIAEAEEERKRQASARQPPRPQKFSGSITVSMGAYVQFAGLKQSELTTKYTTGACAMWSRELQLDAEESRSFRSSCMGLADFANLNGWQLGTKPTQQDSMKFCSHAASQLTGDVRTTFMRTCLKYS
jgi:chemotaxis protein histidine kinase CheA